MSNEQTIIIDTPDAIAHFQMARCISALKIQASTGMTMSRGSMINHCRDNYGTTKRTAKGCLAEMSKLYFDTFGREYGAK